MKLPKFKIYAITNLCGGVGKSTIAFNLSYLLNNLLVIDTCPQGTLSYLFDDKYFTLKSLTVEDILIPYLTGLNKATGAASFIGATNKYFETNNNYYIPSSVRLYLLPSHLYSKFTRLEESSSERIAYSLKTEIERELSENDLDKCIIDTSSFITGATQLAWYAADVLIIPMRADAHSIRALKDMFKYLNIFNDSIHKPKVHMIILTGNLIADTKQVYLKYIYEEILIQNKSLLTTDEPLNHIFFLEYDTNTLSVSFEKRKPISLLKLKESVSLKEKRITVRKSVINSQNDLNWIAKHI